MYFPHNFGYGQPLKMFRQSKDHKLNPLGWPKFSPKNSLGFEGKFKKTEGVRLTPLVFFTGLGPIKSATGVYNASPLHG